MATLSARIVICGAGIAGVAAAYHLAVKQGLREIVLVEQGDPLALTSDKSTEAYRNWWPGPGDTMVHFMNRSIDLLEEIARESGNRILLNRRGYMYGSADANRIPQMLAAARESAALGAGELRIHGDFPDTTRSITPYQPADPHDWEHEPDGVDLLLDPALIRQHFPYLAEETVAVLHARRCGWFSAQQLGMYMLERAKAAGVQVLRGEVTAVDTSDGQVRSVQVSTADGTQQITTDCFVDAAGPLLRKVGALLGIDLPVFSERHIKIAITDQRVAVPRNAPMLIWTDPIQLPWSEEEREELAEDDELSWMLNPLPSGVHCRPEGHGDSQWLLILWNYHLEPVPEVFPIEIEDDYPELALRAMSVMVPALAGYFERPPRPVIDGGYYTKTRENRPLIGPLPVAGAYVIGALSGYGLMGSCAAGELLAAHITGQPLPDYAAALALSRYDDPAYQALLATWSDEGQL